MPEILSMLFSEEVIGNCEGLSAWDIGCIEKHAGSFVDFDWMETFWIAACDFSEFYFFAFIVDTCVDWL